MPTIFVDSNAAGANDGTTWADAFTDINAGISAWTSGDEIWMAHNHFQTQAGGNFSFTTNGNAEDPVVIKRMTSGTSTYVGPPSSANVELTLNTGDMINDGNMSYAGLYVSAPEADLRFPNAASAQQRYVDSYFKWGGIFYISFGTASEGAPVFGNCSFEGQTSSSRFYPQCRGTVRFLGGRTIGSAFLASGLFLVRCPKLVVEGFDCSSMSSGSVICAMTAAGYQQADFIDCKFPANYVLGNITGVATINPDSKITAWNTDNLGDRYALERLTPFGRIKADPTVTFDGADGFAFEGTPLSMLVQPDTNAVVGPSEGAPLELIPVDFYYGGATGSPITVTLEFLENYTVALNAADLWGSIRYLGTAGSNLASFSRTLDLNGSPGALAAGAGLGAWTGEPGGSRSVKLEFTITPERNGVFRVNLFVARYEAGKVLYYNPRAIIT
jgi:hypothetical protein